MMECSHPLRPYRGTSPKNDKEIKVDLLSYSVVFGGGWEGVVTILQRF